MFLRDYLNTTLTPVNLKHTAQEALLLINDFHFSYLPVFKGVQLIGNISREALENMAPNELIETKKARLEPFFLTEQQNLFDAIQLFNNSHTNIVPVLDKEQNYLGYLEHSNLITALAEMPLITEPGAILLVENLSKNLSLSEMAKIVESNNGRLLGIFITEFYGDKFSALIKLNADNLNSVGLNFERFGYTVLHKFYEDHQRDLLKSRYDFLLNYLNT